MARKTFRRRFGRFTIRLLDPFSSGEEKGEAWEEDEHPPLPPKAPVHRFAREPAAHPSIRVGSWIALIAGVGSVVADLALMAHYGLMGSVLAWMHVVFSALVGWSAAARLFGAVPSLPVLGDHLFEEVTGLITVDIILGCFIGGAVAVVLFVQGGALFIDLVLSAIGHFVARGESRVG